MVIMTTTTIMAVIQVVTQVVIHMVTMVRERFCKRDLVC